ncbi:MAG: hypothetical protein AAF738_08280 [Bacteroidota bacterium]
MRIYICLVLCLNVLLLLLACSAADGLPNIITDVDKEFVVRPYEQFALGERTYILEVKSLNIQDCENDTILSTFERTPNDDLWLDIAAIERAGENCIGEPSFAKTTINLGELALGTYDVLLSLKQTIINKGVLTITRDAYGIDMETQYGICWRNSELLRIPAATLWGYIGYKEITNTTAEEFSVLFDSFLEHIQDFVSPVELPAAGYYGHFNWTGEWMAGTQMPEIEIIELEEFAYVQPFVFSSTYNVSELSSAITSFQQVQRDSNLVLHFFTTKDF